MAKAIYVALIAIFLAGLSANDLTCNLCIDIVSAIEDFLTDGATQDDIIAWLEQVFKKRIVLKSKNSEMIYWGFRTLLYKE